MPIRFACQQCQARVKVPDGSEGRKMKCPRCGFLQRVPQASQIPADKKKAASQPANGPRLSRKDRPIEPKPQPGRHDEKQTANQQPTPQPPADPQPPDEPKPQQAQSEQVDLPPTSQQNEAPRHQLEPTPASESVASASDQPNNEPAQCKPTDENESDEAATQSDETAPADESDSREIPPSQQIVDQADEIVEVSDQQTPAREEAASLFEQNGQPESESPRIDSPTEADAAPPVSEPESEKTQELEQPVSETDHDSRSADESPGQVEKPTVTIRRQPLPPASPQVIPLSGSTRQTGKTNAKQENHVEQKANTHRRYPSHTLMTPKRRDRTELHQDHIADQESDKAMQNTDKTPGLYGHFRYLSWFMRGSTVFIVLLTMKLVFEAIDSGEPLWESLIYLFGGLAVAATAWITSELAFAIWDIMNPEEE